MNQLRTYNTQVWVASTAIFLLNPFGGIVFLFHILFSKFKVPKKQLTNLFIVFVSLFLAFINTTKVSENDLIHYREEFLTAGHYNLSEYLIKFGKEPLYFVYNYVVFHLTNGSLKCWMIISTLIIYLFFLSALKRFFYKIKAPNDQLLLGLALAAFFPQLFSLSAHLSRQCIAGAIFLYFAVEYIFYKKHKWWLPFIGVLIHASSLILFPLVYFKFLGNFKRYGFLNIAIMVLLLSYQSIARGLQALIGGKNSTIDYILSRASQDTQFDLGEFPLGNMIFMVFLVIIAMSCKNIVKRQLESSQDRSLLVGSTRTISDRSVSETLKGFRTFSVIVIAFCFFVFANRHQSELSIRLFFYVFFFLPCFFPLFIARFKPRALTSYLLSVAVIAFFIYRLPFGVWNYAPLSELLTNSVFSFLFGNPQITPQS